jgi:hypothetical protein
MREWRYSSIHCLTSTPDGGECSLHAPPAYPHGKSPWYPLDRILGEPQNRSERGGEVKNSQPIPGLGPPIIQPVPQRYTTEISRLVN